MKKKKKGSGGKLNRSEIIQARLNPKLRYMAEIVARNENRTLSSLVESAIDAYSQGYQLEIEIGGMNKKMHLDDILEMIWDSDEILRLVKTGLMSPDLLLSLEMVRLWDFIQSTNYFWAHYEITLKDPKGNFVEKKWEPYYHIDGLLLENLGGYWPLIQTEEERSAVQIPKKLGQEIPAPPGVITEEITPYDSSKPIINRDEQVERYQIWRDNIHKLIKSNFEIIETTEGEANQMQMVFPTPEEQMEMVERIYQERTGCLLNSRE